MILVGMLLGILADIHGNALALEAVLQDARQKGVRRFVNLGDILYGPLMPLRTFEVLLSAEVIATISGNQDRQIVEAMPDELKENSTLAFVVDNLGPKPITWLRTLPATTVVEADLFLCHGTPHSDTTYLLEDVSSGHPVLRADSPILQLLGAVREPVILCGHTHLPRVVQLSSGQLVVNPGSVGLPAYSDDTPVSHSMETHSPHAAYAVLERQASGWTVSLHRVAYDWNEAASQARALGRDDWGRAIATGRMT